VPIVFEDLGRLKTQSLFLPFHRVSYQKSVNNDSLGSEEINTAIHRRWSYGLLAGETEGRHASLEALMNKPRAAGMQNMPGRKVDEGIRQSFLVTTNPSYQREFNSASLTEISRSFARGSEILYTCSRKLSQYRSDT
jgi:hypothetical protein